MTTMTSALLNDQSTKIRITGLNFDKTRKASLSKTLYNVYFALSNTPPQGWRKIFEEEWKTASAPFTAANAQNNAAVDRDFLTVQCPLSEIEPVYLPALKKAITAANTHYDQYELLQEHLQIEKEKIWKDERKNVAEMQKTLTFD
jgi:hypothetical protein